MKLYKIMDPICPQCSCDYPYPTGLLWMCPTCGHEWNPNQENNDKERLDSNSLVVKDAHGNLLQDGDSVTIIKDLPVKGASKSIKVGTKITNIRLVDNDHNIDCKVPGFGAMGLKSEFVKKVND